jgi:hypothetical protein
MNVACLREHMREEFSRPRCAFRGQCSQWDKYVASHWLRTETKNGITTSSTKCLYSQRVCVRLLGFLLRIFYSP